VTLKKIKMIFFVVDKYDDTWQWTLRSVLALLLNLREQLSYETTSQTVYSNTLYHHYYDLTIIQMITEIVG